MDGLKRYVNDDRFRADGDKNMRLLAFAFTIVFAWTGSYTVLCEIDYLYPPFSLFVNGNNDLYFCSFKTNMNKEIHWACRGLDRT